jgi:predicted HTH domain antitoxin
MPLTITDEELQAAGVSAEEARLELASRLFQAGKLDLWPAAQLAGLTRVQMEEALHDRKIPIYVIDEEYWQQELTSLKWLSKQNAANEKLGNLRRRDNVRCDSPL